jgi:hypothetical protein
LHQIAQRQKTDGERTYTDGRNSTDGPAVNPAGCSRTDREGDAVHGGEESDGGHGGRTDLDDDVRDVRQHCVRDEVAPSRKPQKNRTARRWFLWLISVGVLIVSSSAP